MAPNHQNNEAYKNRVQIELADSPNIIIKLSANLLTNPTVQKSLEQLVKFSQPILEKFDIQNMTKWVSQENVYNQLVLANLWLTTHIPQSYSDSALNFVEKRIDFILHLLGEKVEEIPKEKVEEKSLEKKKTTKQEKIHRIIKKLFVLSQFPLKKIETIFKQIQTTQTYITLDKQFHINEKIDKTIHFALLSYNYLRQDILTPSIEYIKVHSNKAKTQVNVMLQGLNTEVLKKKYNQLHAKYEVLQKCVVILSGETVNLVFDKKALAELGEKGKAEIMRLYAEVKTLEVQRIKNIGISYYSEIVKKAQLTYQTAQKSLEEQPKVEQPKSGEIVA